MLYIIVAYFIHSRLYCLVTYSYVVPLPLLSPLVTTILFSISVFCYSHLFVLSFYIPHISDSIQYLSFSKFIYLYCRGRIQIQCQNVVLYTLKDEAFI